MFVHSETYLYNNISTDWPTPLFYVYLGLSVLQMLWLVSFYP